MPDNAMPGLTYQQILERAQKASSGGEPRRKKGRARGRYTGRAGRRQRSYISAKDRKEYARDTDDQSIEKAGKALGSATKIAEALSSDKGQEFLAKLKGAPLGAGAVGLAIAAGLAAYGLTTYIISKLKEKKEGREQLAFQASQAYRFARNDLAERKRRALTRPELDQLANGFKAELKKLGLTTTKLF
jgi:hypothetical protein